jgi:DNA-binding SARP family transcriptional activator/tetratricopeptide (TPR) repeat protein
LLLRPNQVVPTGRIVDDLWGEQPPATAVTMVQGFVSRLRKVLGDGVVETRPGGYAIRLEPGALDGERFEGLLDAGRSLLAAGQGAGASAVLGEGLSLWRGPPLADFQYEAFAESAMGRLEELRLIALELRLQAELDQGHEAEAVAELETLVRDQPLRERPRALLMLALYRSGRQADALGVYQEVRARLLDELGLDPSATLQQLEQAILRQDSELDLELPPVPPPPPSVSKVETRKTVTILFCEIAPSTAVDPEALVDVSRRFFVEASAAIAAHGGRPENVVGNELCGVFGVPAVHEDDALRATRAALEIRGAARGAGLDVRIGLNTGEVVTVGDASISGEVVTVAKRLEEQAAAGEILIGNATYVAVVHAVDATPLGTGAMRVEAVDPDAVAVPRRDDSRFVGRERDLARLRAAYATVSSGEGTRILTVIGEPGIGKSRLIRELLAGLQPAATVLVGRCPPYGEAITFWPLRELLHQAGREEIDLSAPRHQVYAAIRRLFAEASAEQPLVVVFDDVHWAEPTFLDLVEYLGERLGTACVLLLCLARPQLAEHRPAWLQPPADSLVLEPLSEAESELLLESIGVPEEARLRIAATAEGNPLFAEQLAAIAGEAGAAPSMPSSIRGVLHERLDRLERPERAVLERAAVAGRSFSLGSVLDLSPADEADAVTRELLSLVRKRLILPDPLALDDGFRFQHALIRETTYDSTPKSARADLHAQMAARLDAHHGEPALVGYHLEQSFLLRRDLGSVDTELQTRAAATLRRAAQEAFGRSDVPATLALYDRAHALLPADDPTLPALLIELGYARVKRGDLAGAETALDEAIVVGGRLGDRCAEVRALVERQFVRSVAAVGPTAEQSIRVATDAIRELESLDDPLALARAWWLKSEGDVFACRWKERAAALERALGYARQADVGLDVAGTISSLLAQALCYGPTAVPDAVKRVKELLSDARADRALRATLSTSLALLLAMQGGIEIDDARATYWEAVATLEELGLPLRRAIHSLYGAQIELLAGDAEAAVAELAAATETLNRFGARAVAATLDALRADILCTLGHFEEAELLSRAVAVATPEDDLMPQLLWRAALSRVLVQRGEVAHAELLATELLQLAQGLEMPDLHAAVLRAAAEVATATGDPARAEKMLDEARAELSAKGNRAAHAVYGLMPTVANPERTP